MFIQIDQLPRVPLEEMNQIHYREVELPNHLFQSIEAFEDGKVDLDFIKAVYQEFIDDVVSHFSFENQMMEEFNFFAYSIHRGEHDRFLFRLKSV